MSAATTSSNQRVLVTYTAPLSFQASDNWKQILAALTCQLPLHNLHWSHPSRPYIRTVQQLYITLLPFDTLRDERTSQIPVTILEKPLLNIYFFACEDIEVYRNTFKKQIKEWIASVTQRKQEWLIVQVVGPDTRALSGGFFQMKSTVLDKVKADFNVDKRDRCVQLAWSNVQANPAAWVDVMAKLKEGLLFSFETAALLREEEVRRFEGQRQMPGWNFCTFFILKESLASSFEGLHLLEDALLQYDELEALFFHVLRDKNLTWFGSLISPALKDDSAPLLAVDKKPYRDLILGNTISVFDFRIYLLARQCALLGKMGKINEVGTKANSFLAGFGRRLREGEADIPEFFVESWTYSSALSVVEQCDSWAGEVKLEPPALNAFNACKGALLELARNQLDTIGIKIGHLPLIPPFSLAFPSSLPITTPPSPNATRRTQDAAADKISQPDLLASISDREKFFELYIVVTNRAIDMYAKGGRRKFALKLHGSLAALDAHRGQFTSALHTYTSLPAHYAPHMWTSLESLMLSRALETHSALDKPKDREWMHLLLSFLKAYAHQMGLELLANEKGMHQEHLEALVDALKETAESLEEDVYHPDFPIISVQVAGDARIAESEDGSFLDVSVCNQLPCIVPVDEVSLTLSGRDTERFRFTSRAEGIAHGRTALKLFCPSSSSGTFLLESTEIRVGRLHLQWSQPKPTSPSKASLGCKNRVVLVRIPRDPHALDVKIRQPYRVELGETAILMVNVSTGRNSISRATFKLSNSSGVQFQYGHCTLDHGDMQLEVVEGGIALSDIGKDGTVSLLIPYSFSSAFQAMKVAIDVEYTTTSDPMTVRTLHLTRTVSTALPVAVSVQDFFRGTKLISKFTISTTTHQHVRISEVHLEKPKGGPGDVEIVGSQPHSRGIVTITPEQSANFLFRIDSPDGAVREPLGLVVKCRTLREEVEALIMKATQEVLSASPSLVPQRSTLVSSVLEALEGNASWVELYRHTGEVKVPDSNVELQTGELAEGIKALRQTLQVHKYSSASVGEWRELRIPVDFPQMTIVAAARIRVSPIAAAPSDDAHSPPLYAGQPISATLSITTSFHWGPARTQQGKKYMMRFDIEEMVKTWLVSGRKRGDFVACDEATYTVPITLIALHHGELPLPKVAVDALPVTESDSTMERTVVPTTETYQLHGAEAVMVLPRGGRTTFTVGMGAGV